MQSRSLLGSAHAIKFCLETATQSYLTFAASKMVDFDAIDGFNEHAVQGKPIKAYRNGIFENPKSIVSL